MREFFSTANVIDIHNHYGQSLLDIEKVWKVADWETFVTVHSMSFSCEQHCYFQDEPHAFFIDFVDVLASELCWADRQSPSPKHRKSNGEVQYASPKVCSMESVKEMFPSINSKGSGRCKVFGPNGVQCGAEAYYSCRKRSVYRNERKPKLFYM